MTFNVFGLTGYGYGLAAGASALAYLAAAVWLAKRTRFDTETLLLYGVLAIPAGLIVSRLFFCTVNISYFVQTISQPARKLAFWDGGYSMAGMLMGLVLAALLTARLKKLNFRAFLDAVSLPMGAGCIRAAACRRADKRAGRRPPGRSRRGCRNSALFIRNRNNGRDGIAPFGGVPLRGGFRADYLWHLPVVLQGGKTPKTRGLNHDILRAVRRGAGAV